MNQSYQSENKIVKTLRGLLQKWFTKLVQHFIWKYNSYWVNIFMDIFFVPIHIVRSYSWAQ